MVFLFLIITIFFYFLTHFNVRSIFYMAIILIIIPFLIFEFMQSSRIAHLITQFINQPSFILTKDMSITDRLFHVFFS